MSGCGRWTCGRSVADCKRFYCDNKSLKKIKPDLKYRIVVLQKNQFLLRFLKLRVVINGNYIYSLVRNKPVVIEMPTNPAKLVVTDGFHITRPIELAYSLRQTHFFKIACVIEDDQLVVTLILIVLLYAMGATSGIILLQFLSMVPIFYFLFLYYINRKEFIRISPA